jgi:lysozyme family protein
MTDRFEACLAETLKWEGGWSNHPQDPGGATMRGVIQRVYDGYRDGKGIARRTVRAIEDAELREIYRRNYWDLCRAAELPAGVDLAVWDYTVNSGAGQAVKSLQRVLGVGVDGNFGDVTMAAVQRREPVELIRAYLDERRRFYKALRTFHVFGKGWLRRADGIEAAALAMAGQTPLDVALNAPAPLPDKDAQSASQGKATAAPPAPPKTTEVSLGVGGLTFSGTGWASFFGKVGAMQAPSLRSVLFAALSEPLILAGIVMTVAAFTTWLWRRRHA